MTFDESNKTSEEVVKAMQNSVPLGEQWNLVINGIASLFLSISAIVLNLQTATEQPSNHILILIIIASAVALLTFAAQVVFLLKKKALSASYNYFMATSSISKALLTSFKRINFEKTSCILQSTYEKVSEWHPIDYNQNVLIYDVHEHLRKICISIKQAIISLNPEDFNDDKINVDIAFSYPSDHKFEPFNGLSNDVCCDLQSLDDNQDYEKNKWKIITSGDRTSTRIHIHDFLDETEENSFYNYFSKIGYIFGNDKAKLEEEGHYIMTSKDKENGNVGSIAGLVIELKNDNPETPFVRVYLTINTYGRRFVEAGDLLDEDSFKKVFKETVINSYKSLIEAELAQMFIRHGITHGFINRNTGELKIKAKNKTPKFSMTANN